MKKIFKYEIPVIDKFSILMPYFGRVLTVQTKHDVPYIWVLINDKNYLRERHFKLYATGREIIESNDYLDFIDYVGTFQQMNGGLVWHLFDLYYEEDQ